MAGQDRDTSMGGIASRFDALMEGGDDGGADDVQEAPKSNKEKASGGRRRKGDDDIDGDDTDDRGGGPDDDDDGDDRNGGDDGDLDDDPAGDLGDGDSDGDDDDGDGAGEEDEGGEGGDGGEGETPSSLEDLAASAGVSTDDLLEAVKHKIDIDGKEVEVSLAELVRSHEGTERVNARMTAVEEQSENLTRAHQAASEDYGNRVGRLGAILQAAEQALLLDAESDAMKQLRAQNPAEWGARMTEIQQRKAGVHQLFQNVVQEWDNQKSALAEQMKAGADDKRAAEDRKIKEAIPKWDETYRASVLSYIQQSGGYSKEEIDAIPVIDHRMMIMANKARLYDAMASKGLTKTKPKAVQAKKGKTLPPNKGKSGDETEAGKGNRRRESGKYRAKRRDLRKSGSLDDAADVFNMRLRERAH